MDGLTVISEALGSLHALAKKDTVFLDDVPHWFRADVQNFITGATLSLKDGKVVIGHNLYKQWLKKIKTKGFDYEIDFKR